MNILSPAIAANFATISYENLDKRGLRANPYFEKISPLFSFESESIKGVSGSIIERVLNFLICIEDV